MDAPAPQLPPLFERWFASRGWTPRPHQLDCVAASRAGRSHLLIAPTGGGKTLAGFLPSLIGLHQGGSTGGPHTLYISPLKALAVDIALNVERPIAELGLDISIEARTGDTPAHRRQRQKYAPPDLLLTTPEQIALMLTHSDAAKYFSGLKRVIIDELHSFHAAKRGHLLALNLAALRRHAPGLCVAGLSATVADPEQLLKFLTPQAAGATKALLIRARGGASPAVGVFNAENRIPWSGHSARHAFREVYEEIKRRRMTLVFVNTRSQAEMTFQALWSMNDDNLPIALHHGSLDAGQRRKVEAAMTKGALRAVVCTSTLDLGIDWGDVDLVIQIGAPKGASRLTQRIGRANHRMDEPSSALLIPGNRFEALECIAAKAAIEEGALDGDETREGALDVLAQHIAGVACSAPFSADDLYAEVISTAPYASLSRETFDQAVAFAATGGYALKTYERFRRIVKTPDGLYRIRNAHVAQQHRMNAGTIIDAPSFNIRVMSQKRRRGPGRKLGTMEEWFIESLAPGDTFRFAGEVLRFEGIDATDAFVTRAPGEDPRIPSWNGGKFPLTTYLAARVRRMIHDEKRWRDLPEQIRDWLISRQRFFGVPVERQHIILNGIDHSRFHPGDASAARTLAERRWRLIWRKPFTPQACRFCKDTV